MKIEVKNRDSNSYDEILSLSKNSKKVYVNPKLKIVPYSLVYFKWIWILLFIMVILFVLLFVPDCRGIAVIGLFVMLCFEIRMIKNYFYCRNVLSDYSNRKTTTVIEFSKDRIYLKNDIGNETTIPWDSIKFIVANKYSIAFFQDNVATGPVLGFSIKYMNELLEVLERYNFMNLLVDNRELYK